MTRWHWLQFAIVCAFVASNIQWHWVENNLAAGVMGGMAAWYLTRIADVVLTRRRARRGESLIADHETTDVLVNELIRDLAAERASQFPRTDGR